MRQRRLPDRIRAAICVALADVGRQGLSVPELVDAITSMGLPLGQRPNKVIADAVRWEVGRRHVRRIGRGQYAIDSIPESTLRYMRVRVALYVIDPSRSYSRPYYGNRVLADGTIIEDTRMPPPEPAWPT